jgi:hypothetical protein
MSKHVGDRRVPDRPKTTLPLWLRMCAIAGLVALSWLVVVVGITLIVLGVKAVLT